MKISYEEAIGNLQKMFSGVDKEVIQTILAMHKGKIDPTIEDLLKLTNDAVDEDNIFDDGKEQKSYEPAFGGGLDDDFAEKQRQEERDMELALKLQEQEVKEAKRAELRASQTRAQGAGGYGGSRSQYQQQQYQPQYQYQQQQYQPQPYQQQQYRQPSYPISNQQQPRYQQSQPSYSQPVEEKKKKKKFSEKMKDAKVKFLSLFKKSKKKGKEGVGNNNAGGYAEIDNLEDIKDINEGMNNVKLYDELDDIPDIEANPYTGQNPYSNGNDRVQPLDDSEKSESDEDINEEAKANFKFSPEMSYNRPDFDTMKQKQAGASYPKFDRDDEYDPDLREYYNDKKISAQGEDLI